jgi:hypothetical protein
MLSIRYSIRRESEGRQPGFEDKDQASLEGAVAEAVGAEGGPAQGEARQFFRIDQESEVEFRVLDRATDSPLLKSGQ